MGRRGVGCRKRGRDETRCHSHDVDRVTLSDLLLGHSDGPIARPSGRRLVVLFVRRAETQCLWDIGRAAVAQEARVVTRLAARRTDCRRIGARRRLHI